MRNISGKPNRENRNKHFRFNNFFFKRSVFEIINIVKPDRPQMAIWRMRIACWVTKATNTLRICNTYCLSTATMVAGARLNILLKLV